MKIKVAPSILSCDFGRLAEQVRSIERAGADLVHVDVMDGHFVPNITIGPVVVKDIRKATRLPLDVHLMIEHPEKFIDAFAAAGSDMITVHIEAAGRVRLSRIRARVKSKGIAFGISLNPGTPFAKIKRVCRLADFILVMSVNPGFGGQDFIPSVVPKIKKLREVFRGDIAVDGGINEATGRLVAEAGANVLVAGSHIFKSGDYARTIRRLKWVLHGRK
ncbi:MAG: ribulose-phosphate 3-epimerase [Candidatus Omnitrophica bacterium]|nr:ribulose-phosphate 3-epimerase [Candidatus Omnitrophota bacterium]